MDNVFYAVESSVDPAYKDCFDTMYFRDFQDAMEEAERRVKQYIKTPDGAGYTRIFEGYIRILGIYLNSEKYASRSLAPILLDWHVQPTIAQPTNSKL